MSMDSEIINIHADQFELLSNFSALQIEWKRQVFATVEHAYQWESFSTQNSIGFMGSVTIGVRNNIMLASSPHEAHAIAQKSKSLRRRGWDQKEFKVRTMFGLLVEKARQHEIVQDVLKNINGRPIHKLCVEDAFWGTGPDMKGLNVLGQLWMIVEMIFLCGELDTFSWESFPLDVIVTERTDGPDTPKD